MRHFFSIGVGGFFSILPKFISGFVAYLLNKLVFTQSPPGKTIRCLCAKKKLQSSNISVLLTKSVISFPQIKPQQL